MAQNATDFFQAHPLILALIKILIVFAVLSGIVAYLVYMERKVLSFMQARLGPMRVGPWGLLQPVADGIKLLLKEDIIPAGADRFVFLLAPTISVMAAFTVFAVIPFAGNFYISDINIGLLFILGVSSLGIYGIILGGWSSNSHYPLLGALRSAAQLVSYEVAAGMALAGVLLISNSLSMVEIVNRQQQMGVWNVFLQPVAFVIYLIAAVAETNRNPFDLPEAESELTAGFHTEYSGFRFALYFLAEYTNMVVVSCIAVTMFLGGWLRPFANIHALDFLRFAPILAFLGSAAFILWLGLKSLVPLERYFFVALAVSCVLLAGIVAIPAVLGAIQGIFWFGAKVLAYLYAFIWYRATFPRYRYDQLMNVGWHWMIPIGLGNLIVTALVRYFTSSHMPASPGRRVGRVMPMGLTDLLRRVFLVDLIKGLRLTFSYQRPSATYTEQYPLERPIVAERYRGAPRLNNHPETGETLCIACNLCALACPENLIVVGWARTEERKKRLTTFTYDLSRCMFCGLCEDACPVDALELTQDFEIAEYSREGMIWDRQALEEGPRPTRYTR